MKRNGTGTSHIFIHNRALLRREAPGRGLSSCARRHADLSQQMFCSDAATNPPRQKSLPRNVELRGLLLSCSGQTLASWWVFPRVFLGGPWAWGWLEGEKGWGCRWRSRDGSPSGISDVFLSSSRWSSKASSDVFSYQFSRTVKNLHQLPVCWAEVWLLAVIQLDTWGVK